jgi:hypothetical protein
VLQMNLLCVRRGWQSQAPRSLRIDPHTSGHNQECS